MTQPQTSISVIADPRAIQQNDLPFHFVLSNQATSLISWAIDWKTKSNYGHCMQSINAGKFITQDFGGYHEVPMDGYLKNGGILKFIKLTNSTPQFNSAFIDTIKNRLSQPWYKKLYDFPNILGRAIGLNWIHLPGTFDCSEVSLWAVRQNTMYLTPVDAGCIIKLPLTASPDDIDDMVKNNPTIFTIYGIWSADSGIVV